ncbi:hypothetical protein [Arcticibacter eurypsychrophilus]|uniref:hypothetical protein n=1 Tax=Arcticibacter eurypsychrophilus TaxID=1434752 RepID=UPI00084D5FE9|nr:hypothetical protein [Arcticibacter eurypsychrophilus]
MKNQEINNQVPEENVGTEEERNDTASTGDDTIGENTELTPLALEVIKDNDTDAEIEKNQEETDFPEKNG